MVKGLVRQDAALLLFCSPGRHRYWDRYCLDSDSETIPCSSRDARAGRGCWTAISVFM